MQDEQILNIKARQIFDSRGQPTVEVDLQTKLGTFRASVPSGASTGKYQALQLRDNIKSQYLGKGVSSAIKNVNEIIRPALMGKSVTSQRQLDKYMVQILDGTKNQYGWSKSKLGANAILPVSLALAKATAAHKKIKLYEYIRQLSNSSLRTNKYILPCPAFNLINGGKHGGNKLAMQQFMILPTGAKSFAQAMKVGVEVYHHLKNIIQKKHGIGAINVGDEGGFAPPNLNSGEQALQILMQALKASGHDKIVQIGMDCAASQFYNEQHNCYDLSFKYPQSQRTNNKLFSSEQLCQLYIDYTKKYPIISIQDPFDQDDTSGWKSLTSSLSSHQIVGDDLLVTNKQRIIQSIKQKHCNALLLKLNQIGTLTEAIEAQSISKDQGWGTMVSHRSGETEDTFIADLVVGLGTGQIKTGAPCRSQRLAKYNQLLRIQQELGENAIYAGKMFRYPYKLITE